MHTQAAIIPSLSGGDKLLHLLPKPQELEPLAGVFTLVADTLILIPALAGDDTFLAARQLADEIYQAAGLETEIIKAFTPPRRENVILLVCGAGEAAAFGLEPLPTAAPERVAEQAYVLTVEPARIILYANAPAGLFYAAQTLRQLARLSGRTLPALTIRDWPVLPYRGLMLDISRRKVPTLETLTQLAMELAHYKINVLQLYTEHTFQFPRHPKIGAGCGSLSSRDILELDRVCRAHHVELMPNLQSLGHFRNTLTIPEYRHLAETDVRWVLSPAFAETYTLLDDLYADMLPSFTSAVFNVDCDEAWNLGQGAAQALADEIGVGRVYLGHILRLREIAANYGRRIQVWGDILLNHPELIGELPDDVTLLDWHYEAAAEYPTVETFAAAGRRFWVCPGVSSWNTLFPRIHNANANIRNFVRDGVAAGAEGMLNTDWGDHGHYQPLGLSWYGYLFGAAQGWSGGTMSDDEFEAAFGPLFFGPGRERILEAMRQLARTNTLTGVPCDNGSNTVLALFDEPLTGETIGALSPETLAEMRSLAGETAAAFDALAPGHPRELTLREMALVARLTGYAARKVSTSQEIRQGLCDSGLTEERIYGYIQALESLDVELEPLRAEFETLWLARARRSEIHVTLNYYAKLRTRYQAAVDWLEEQRQALLSGRAVDSDLSTYVPGNYRVLWYTWPD